MIDLEAIGSFFWLLRILHSAGEPGNRLAATDDCSESFRCVEDGVASTRHRS
jgi:hypothetical protein